jgi:hypothetical protein
MMCCHALMPGIFRTRFPLSQLAAGLESTPCSQNPEDF